MQIKCKVNRIMGKRGGARRRERERERDKSAIGREERRKDKMFDIFYQFKI